MCVRDYCYATFKIIATFQIIAPFKVIATFNLHCSGASYLWIQRSTTSTPYVGVLKLVAVLDFVSLHHEGMALARGEVC